MVPLAQTRERKDAAPAGAADPARACRHCGEPCDRGVWEAGGDAFCCRGCQTVYALLQESGLGDFYHLAERPGTRRSHPAREERWVFLDDPEVARRLLDFTDGQVARVTFRLPAIHCVACVWLLENLFRLHPGIGRTRVNFARREVAITYSPERVRLSEVAALLERIGYDPDLTLAELDRPRRSGTQRLALQVGVAGFAFGNIMLFSLPQYFGLDSFSGPRFRAVFGGLSLLLALPALAVSAADYWRSALASLRQRALTLDVPIALGMAALYAQSAWEILSATGEGYLDTLTGLIFFLLCGRAFQQKTHERLGFDRDYRGFFPLAVVRRTDRGEETVSINRLNVGDHLLVRHGELVPADARVVGGEALIDYSFVTGESEPVVRPVGAHLYAGGRQVGGAVEVETIKPVSQSYLVSLWNEEAFRKPRERSYSSLTNRFSRGFTLAVIAVAAVAAAGWMIQGSAARGLQAFTSVLIVACPCALALAAPFTLGSAQRLLARRGVFVRNGQVLESMAAVDAIALDKTGTLTETESLDLSFHGPPLDDSEVAAVAAVCRQSAHPLARRIVQEYARAGSDPSPAGEFCEVPGRGCQALVGGRCLTLGSLAWFQERHFVGPFPELPAGSAVYLAIDGRFRGAWVVENRCRPAIDRLVSELAGRYPLALISGDNERERGRFSQLLGDDAELHFHLGPHEKLAFIRRLQEQGRQVMMVGDGLNDAGALRQSEVGVAVVEGAGKFSPASDVILDAARVPWLARILDFSHRTTGIIRAGLALSVAYNGVGVSVAAAGMLSPLVCAILMPLSSLSVVLFAVGATHWAARRSKLSGLAETKEPPQTQPAA